MNLTIAHIGSINVSPIATLLIVIVLLLAMRRSRR